MELSAVAEDGTISIQHGDDRLARYRAETTASKPHFDVFALPRDASDAPPRNLALAAPHDHAWHLGLFFYQKLVDGVNCWESEQHEDAGKT